jgi:hypothetical protein
MKLSDLDALKLSRAFSGILSGYELTKNELRLGIVILQKTFLQGSVFTRLDFAALAIELGGREKDWFTCFQHLLELGVVMWNQGEGVVQGNTDVQALSRKRALRAAPGQASDLSDALPLRGERLLDDSLAAVNREAALASQPETESGAFDVRAYCQKFRSALDAGTVDQFAAEHPPPAGDGRQPPLATVASSSASAIASAQASVPKASAKLKLADGEQPRRQEADARAAWDRLVAVDKTGARLRAQYAEQWQKACRKDPDRVLAMIRYMEPRLHKIENPWAYLSNMARSKDWGVMR